VTSGQIASPPSSADKEDEEEQEVQEEPGCWLFVAFSYTF